MTTFANGIRLCVNPKAKHLCSTVDNVLYNLEKSDRSTLAWQTCRSNMKSLNNRKINSPNDVPPLTRGTLKMPPFARGLRKVEQHKAERSKNMFYQLLKASQDIRDTDNDIRSYIAPCCGTTRQFGGKDNNYFEIKDDRIFNEIYDVVKSYLVEPINTRHNPFLLVNGNGNTKIKTPQAVQISSDKKKEAFYPTIPVYKVNREKGKSSTSANKEKPTKKARKRNPNAKTKKENSKKTSRKSKKQKSQKYNGKINRAQGRSKAKDKVDKRKQRQRDTSIYFVPKPIRKMTDASSEISKITVLKSPRDSSLSGMSQMSKNSEKQRLTPIQETKDLAVKTKNSFRSHRPKEHHKGGGSGGVGGLRNIVSNRSSKTKVPAKRKQQAEVEAPLKRYSQETLTSSVSPPPMPLGYHKSKAKSMENVAIQSINRPKASHSLEFHQKSLHSILNRSSSGHGQDWKDAKKTRLSHIPHSISLTNHKGSEEIIDSFEMKRKMFSIIPDNTFNTEKKKKDMSWLMKLEEANRDIIEPYEKRLGKLKRYLDSESSIQCFNELNIDDISVSHLLLYPYPYPIIQQQQQEQQEQQMPVKSPLRRKRKLKEMKKEPSISLDEPSETSNPCCICHQMHRNGHEKDAPFIAQMKKESKRQELKAYLNQMQTIGKERELQNLKDNEIIRQTVTICNGVPHCKSVKYMAKKPILLME